MSSREDIVKNSALMTAYKGLAYVTNYRKSHRLSGKLAETLAFAEDGLNNMVIEFGKIGGFHESNNDRDW